jgi:hypothetical protein
MQCVRLILSECNSFHYFSTNAISSIIFVRMFASV